MSQVNSNDQEYGKYARAYYGEDSDGQDLYDRYAPTLYGDRSFDKELGDIIDEFTDQSYYALRKKRVNLLWHKLRQIIQYAVRAAYSAGYANGLDMQAKRYAELLSGRADREFGNKVHNRVDQGHGLDSDAAKQVSECGKPAD